MEHVSASGTTVIVFAKVGNGKVILIGQAAPETVKECGWNDQDPSSVNLQPYNGREHYPRRNVVRENGT